MSNDQSRTAETALTFVKNVIVGVGRGVWFKIQEFMGSRFFLYMYDYIAMRFTAYKRHRQLAYDHLTCRFCNSDIELLGFWRCGCGYTRPGNYFGRCPKCLGHPEHIDCPACSATMDVR